jgi:hypothetical protein
MTQESLSPALRAAILAAVAAFEQDERPVRDLSSSSEMWRVYGRRMQMAVRFDGRHVMPSLPIGHRGWERAPWRAMR